MRKAINGRANQELGAASDQKTSDPANTVGGVESRQQWSCNYENFSTQTRNAPAKQSSLHSVV